MADLRKIVALIIITFCFISPNWIIAQNPVIFQAPDTTGYNGTTINIPIRFSIGTNLIGAFGFRLDFDPTIVQYDTFANGPIIPPGTGWITVVNTVGDTAIFCGGASFGGGPISSSGNLVFLSFKINPAAPLNSVTELAFSELSAGDYVTGLDLPVDSINGSITVISSNHDPVAINDTTITDEEIPVIIDVLANDYDIDGDDLIISSVNTSGISGTVIIEPGDTLLSYHPDLNFFGSESFSYTISDGHGGEATANVYVTVNPVNDPPVAVNDLVSTPEDSSIIIHVLQNDYDVDGDPLTINSLIVTNTLGTATINPGDTTVFYQPLPNFYGNDSFLYVITDGSGLMDTAAVHIQVTSQNDPPVAVDDTSTTPEDTSVVIHILKNDHDPDGDPLTIHSVDPTGLQGTVVINPGDSTVTYTPMTNFFGTEIFSYIVSDGQGGLTTATVTVHVLSRNDPPTISGLPGWIMFNSGSSTTLNIWNYVDDVETPDSLLLYQFPASHDSLHRSYNNSTGILTLWANPPFGGNVILYIIVEDDSNATATDSVLVIVNPGSALDFLSNLGLPRTFTLEQNYPNPFNPRTRIRFGLPRASRVSVEVYNSLGQKIATLLDLSLSAGYYDIDFDGQNLPSGQYFYRIQAGDFTAVKRMLLLK
ncbi:MAG: hypothetical protein Kow0042_16000 [Calditrichia bacterium]